MNERAETGEAIASDRRPAARRWRQRVGYAIATIGAAIFIGAVSILGWRYYTESRLGRVELTTDDEPVVAQVLDETGERAIGDPFDLATRAVLSLPEGDYQLRVNGLGRIGRTFRFAVNRGEMLEHEISINEGRLPHVDQSPVGVPAARGRGTTTRFLSVRGAREIAPGKADFIEFNPQSFIRRDGASGNVIWDAFHPTKPFASDRDPVRWMRHSFWPKSPGGLMKQTPDLDRDGIGDLVLFNDFAPAVLAVSGKDGSMIWNYVAELNGRGGPRDLCPEARQRKRPGGFTAGGSAMIDVDRDGTLELCVTFVFEESIRGARVNEDASPRFDGTNPARRRSMIVALSGRSGRSVWTHPVEPDFVQSKDERVVKPAELVRGRRLSLLAFAADTHWLGLDPLSGEARAGPVAVDFKSARLVGHADLDGDGEPEIVTVEPGPGGRDKTLRVISIEGGRELWEQVIDAELDSFEFPASGQPRVSPPSCPLVADLDGDGRSEIVVPDAGPMPPLAGYRGVRLLDGRDGTTRWRHAMRVESKEEDGVAEIVAAPDLDGDGTRDVVTVSLVAPPEAAAIWIDALSGKDGRPLWWWNLNVPMDESANIWTPFWWGRGPDGWPLLAIPLAGSSGSPFDARFSTHRVFLLEASTGRERHVIAGLSNASVADLDGDGLADLWGDVGGELRAFRAEAPEAWRALGSLQPALSEEHRSNAGGTTVADLDRDGVGDLILAEVQAPDHWSENRSGSRTAIVRSGRDGHVIWNAALDPWEGWMRPYGGEQYALSALPLPGGDFDGDGVVDVIITRYEDGDDDPRAVRTVSLPIQVRSGRTGVKLWAAGPLPAGARAFGEVDLRWIESRSVEPSGASDLIVCYYCSFHAAGSTKPGGSGLIVAERLARLSGRDGRMIWDVGLSEKNGGTALVKVSPHGDIDLDGDGGCDIVLGPSSSTNVDMADPTVAAISLRDGKQIWSRPLHNAFSTQFEIVVAQGAESGRRNVIVLDQLDGGDRLDLRVRAFNGGNGEPGWSTKPGMLQANRPSDAGMVTADFDGSRKPFFCAYSTIPGEARRIGVLNQNGEECARRDLAGNNARAVLAADIDGNGRDELLAWGDGVLFALDRELKTRWTRPTVSKMTTVVVSHPAGRGPELMILPAIGLDGATGRPKWIGQVPLVPQQFTQEMLDPGDSTRLPILIRTGLGATVGRFALETNSEGRVVEASGRRAKARSTRDDPRWARPLPWARRLQGPFGPWGLLVAMGLAVVSVFIPVFVIRLARGRRRNYTIQSLMSVPVAVAIPLLVYLTVVPQLPPSDSPLLATETRMFVTGTLAGVPLVACLIWVGASVVRRRWWQLAGLLGLFVVATAAVASGWIWVDRKSMAVGVEHYEWNGCELVATSGAYVAAIFWMFGVGILGCVRRLRSAVPGVRGTDE